MRGTPTRAGSRRHWLCLLLCLSLIAPFLSLEFAELARAQVPGLPALPRLTGPTPGPNLPNLNIVKETGSMVAPQDGPITLTQPPPLPALCPDCCPHCDPDQNQDPVAHASGPYQGQAGSAIQFNGTGSYDSDGNIVSYQWNFGDGSTSADVSPTHTYMAALTYTVTLTVVDNHGATGTATTTAEIKPPPMPTPTPTPAQTNGAVFVSQSVPASMIGGQSYSVSVTMNNTGTRTWTAADLHRLGSQNAQDNSTWGVSRVAVPSSIAPNANGTFSFTVTAPTTAGAYNFQWRLVQDGVGWFGDFTPNVTVNVAPVPPAGGEAPNLSMARLDPANRTGEAGDDLFSRNYNWSVPLVGLPGRAGLDLDLALTYNSLVWTKWGTTINYDSDHGFPTPGFRLGFPVIQGRFRNEQAVKDAYLLITSSGKRVELRQTDQVNVFASTDSSHLRLEINNNLLLKTPDGTQLNYVWIGNEYKCTEVKDRNGNFITISYDNLGHILTITDTLARVINFNYDNRNLLQSITQTWLVNGEARTHSWARFVYGDLPFQTNYPGLTVNGPQNGESIPVLWKVIFPDNSDYFFHYTSWGQMYAVNRQAADGHLLSSMGHYLPNNANDPQSDCPRIYRRNFWAEDWVAPNQHQVTLYSTDSSTGAQVATFSDQTVYKEYYAASGWQKGLLTRTENYAPGESNPRKWTIVDWTQDNTQVNYQANPRPIETNVYDSDGNHRRSTVQYNASGWPTDAFEFAPDGAVLRRTHTDYNEDTEYANRHILGLTSARFLFGRDPVNGTEKLYAKVKYEYDASSEFLVGQGAPVQHDEVNYGLTLVQGRANLTSVRRFDVDYPNDTGKVVSQTIGYNSTGLPYFARDPLGHQTTIGYGDWFSDSVNHNAMAYPTTVTNADGFSSLSQYNYDFGAVTRSEGPPPQGFTQGAIQTNEFDAIGRLLKVNEVNGAYTRYEYPATSNMLSSFTTINSLTQEAYSAKILDGRGAVRAVASDLPTSVGGYVAQYFIYDLMGRLIKQSNPTETSATGPNWEATGDDATLNGGNGWVYTQQTYDWRGRPLVTTNQDGTTKTASYGGCGCAGGEVVTLTDEGTLISGGVTKKRQQKIYSDVLGRTVKTEILNWDGAGPNGTGGSVYSSTVNTYNGRDQVTLARQFQGTAPANANDLSCPSGTCQQTSMTYDGYGRLKTKHVPQQDAGTATTWDYNPDDTVQKVTDARGASATYAYNGRHQVTGITYAAPAGITIPNPVSFAYDAAGNRTSMTDGAGSVSYHHDGLSRLTSESRQFAGLAGSYELSYQYNLAGQLKSITDPAGATINYAFDSVGRPTAVTGSSFGGVTQYVTNVQYRAWGTTKALSYGNTRGLSASYNSRLQPTHFEITNAISKDYEYHADGRLKSSADLLDNRFDRSYSYDHGARISQAFSGPAARGEADTNNRPYKQFYQYDGMNHLVGRVGSELWSTPVPGYSDTDSYLNNRNTEWLYDANGALLSSDAQQYTYDAAGRAITVLSDSGDRIQSSTFDGAGRRTKMVDSQAVYDENQNPTEPTVTTSYEVSSTLLDAVVTELDQTGQKTRSFVYGGGQVLAWQKKTGEAEYVLWEYRDPSNASYRMASTTGLVLNRSAELDPLGADAGTRNPWVQPRQWPVEDRTYPGFADMISGNCDIDGIPGPCSIVDRLVRAGAGTVLPPGVSANDISVDHNTGDLLIRGTNLVINPNSGMVSRRNWINGRDRVGDWETRQGFDFETGEPMDIYSHAIAGTGHWEYTFVSATWQNLREDHEFAHSRRVRCPPTREQLANNPVVKKTIKEAFRKATEFRKQHGHWIEHGGWIYQNRRTGEIATYIKPPDLSPPLPKSYPYTDSGYRVFLHNPPSMPGFDVVGDFHIHAETGPPNEHDDAVADSHKAPGVLGTPDGKTYPYGNYRRGIFGKGTPPNCQ